MAINFKDISRTDSRWAIHYSKVYTFSNFKFELLPFCDSVSLSDTKVLPGETLGFVYWKEKWHTNSCSGLRRKRHEDDFKLLFSLLYLIQGNSNSLEINFCMWRGMAAVRDGTS